MDVKLTYVTNRPVKRYWDERTELSITVDGKEIAVGSFGGEPEDNSHYRDYSWVRPAFESLAKSLGANVTLDERITTEEY